MKHCAPSNTNPYPVNKDELRCSKFNSNIQSVKPVLRGHLRDKDKVAL